MAQAATLLRIPIDRLKVSKFNVRSNVGDISDLISSIKAVGILEPIVVRSVGKQFEIVIGSRRFAAARKAGLKTVPALVREMTDDQAIVESLAENLQRGDVEEEEIIKAYNVLKKFDQKKWTQQAFATKIGKSQEWVSRLLTAYETLIKLRDAGMKASMKTYPTREERESGAIPRSHLEEIEYALRSDEVTHTLAPKQVEKKRVELAKATSDLDYDDTKRMTNRFKMYPEKPVEKLKEEVLAEKTGVALRTYLTPSVARQIEEQTGHNVEDALPEVIGKGLEAITKGREAAFTREVPVKEGMTYDIGRFECPIHKRQYTLKCDGKKVDGKHWVE